MNKMSDSENKENKASSTFVPPPTPLLKKIGFGTGVSVYHLDRSPCNHAVRSPWALKTVNRQHSTTSNFQERLETEAKILQDLSHPNIVGFRGLSKTKDGRKVLAMEECNESLGDLIERLEAKGGVRFEPEKILAVVAGVSKALKYLHEEKGLLHGDLKSYNVLIKGNFEEVKLCDFGVSLELKTAKVEDYVGSGPWMAPETMEDEGPLTEKADIFSLGLIIYEMLTLKIPHTGDDCNTASSGTFDSSTVECEQCYGETPSLPEGLPARFALVTELYQWCTQQDARLRPRARDILQVLAQNGFPLEKQPLQITL